MLRAVLVCAAALACFHLAAFAQPAGEKKGEPAKTKDDPTKAGKSKTADKGGEGSKEIIKSKAPLDQLRLPSNVVIVVVEDLFKATELIPKQFIMDLDEWRAFNKRVEAIERQLKGERVLPSTCTLVGKLTGDFLVFDVEYIFATGPGRSTVPLGLQGSFLIKDAKLDKQPAILELDKDDSFLARVDGEGKPHRLTLSVRVPVKKSLTGGLDRSIDLGLPPASGIILHLDVPKGVKELRWNGNAEKPKSDGHWEIGVDRSKSLNLSWKEPLPPSANKPLVTVENNIKVDVDATHVNITTEVWLQDLRPRTEEWHLHLPPLAKVESVKGPTGLSAKIEETAPFAIVKVPVTSDRWLVTVTQRVPRLNPGPRLPIGPFQALGAFVQQGALQLHSPTLQHGTISVKMPVEASLGQRLFFTRSGKINQTKNTEAEAAFQYVGPAGTDANIKAPLPFKAPLEIEWRFDRNQLRTDMEHTLKLKTTSTGVEVDVATQIRVNALFATVGAIDLKMPQPRPAGALLTGTATPGLCFPGGLPWSGVAGTLYLPWSFAQPDEFTWTDKAGNPLKAAPQESAGTLRVLWTGAPVKQATLELKSTYRVLAPFQRARLELPRPLNTQERGAKVTILADDRIELLHGPEGAEEPVPERNHFELTAEKTPAVVHLAWRPNQREVVTQATIDVDVHENSAQVQQTLRFPRDRSVAGPEAKNAPIALNVPRSFEKAPLVEGAKVLNFERGRGTLWVLPSADAGEFVELKLQYDLSIADKQFEVTPVWPAHGSQEDVKVRIWTSPGVAVRLTPEARVKWKERSTELVRERDHFPSLVLAGYGANLPLTLEIDASGSTSPAAFLADRALVRVRVAEDGSQQVQARYWIRKINAPFVDVELPLAMSRLREPSITLGTHRLTQWKKLDGAEKVLRLELHPDLATLPARLEIAYTIPADALEQMSVWSTTMSAPTIRSEVVIGQMHWHLVTPTPVLAASFGRHVHADNNWSLQGWLFTPEPMAVDGDAWLIGKEATQPGPAVTFAFAHVSMQPETVYHLPRPWWLLGCSGAFLILTLGIYFSPLPRGSLWFLLAILAGALAAFTLMFPAAWSGVVFGLQPGVVLFLLFIGVHWLVQERYRRQLVFLPGFTRPKSGSTITRSNVAKRPRENSTVDAPPAIPDTASAPTAPPASGT